MEIDKLKEINKRFVEICSDFNNIKVEGHRHCDNCGYDSFEIIYDDIIITEVYRESYPEDEEIVMLIHKELFKELY